MWIRARRLQWLGHILRLGQERQIKQAVFEMYKSRKQGDLLMDAPTASSWRELCTYTMDREYWRARVRKMKQPRVRVQLGPHVVEGAWAPFTISMWNSKIRMAVLSCKGAACALHGWVMTHHTHYSSSSESKSVHSKNYVHWVITHWFSLWWRWVVGVMCHDSTVCCTAAKYIKQFSRIM